MPIRPATIEDAPQITALLCQLGYSDEQEAVAGRLEMLSAQAGTVVLAAEDDDHRLTGCIQVVIASRLAEGRYGEIASLVVAEGQRGLGVGRQLVESASDWLTGRGVSRLRVRCNAIREEAHRFYAHLGFDLTKSQKIFDRDLPPVQGMS